MKRSRITAHYAAHDLVVAILRQDECRSEFLREDCADEVERALADVAGSLGYTIHRIDAAWAGRIADVEAAG